MAAAAAKTARNRLSGDTLTSVRRSAREHHPCRIKGCKRTAYKGALCKRHWDMVPVDDKRALMVETWEAQRAVSAKHHRRFLRELQARL
jgi:hypothetical protein